MSVPGSSLPTPDGVLVQNYTFSHISASFFALQALQNKMIWNDREISLSLSPSTPEAAVALKELSGVSDIYVHICIIGLAGDFKLKQHHPTVEELDAQLKKIYRKTKFNPSK